MRVRERVRASESGLARARVRMLACRCMSYIPRLRVHAPDRAHVHASARASLD